MGIHMDWSRCYHFTDLRGSIHLKHGSLTWVSHCRLICDTVHLTWWHISNFMYSTTFTQACLTTCTRILPYFCQKFAIVVLCTHPASHLLFLWTWTWTNLGKLSQRGSFLITVHDLIVKSIQLSEPPTTITGIYIYIYKVKYYFAILLFHFVLPIIFSDYVREKYFKFLTSSLFFPFPLVWHISVICFSLWIFAQKTLFHGFEAQFGPGHTLSIPSHWHCSYLAPVWIVVKSLLNGHGHWNICLWQV